MRAALVLELERSFLWQAIPQGDLMLTEAFVQE